MFVQFNDHHFSTAPVVATSTEDRHFLIRRFECRNVHIQRQRAIVSYFTRNFIDEYIHVIDWLTQQVTVRIAENSNFLLSKKYSKWFVKVSYFICLLLLRFIFILFWLCYFTVNKLFLLQRFASSLHEIYGNGNCLVPYGTHTNTRNIWLKPSRLPPTGLIVSIEQNLCMSYFKHSFHVNNIILPLPELLSIITRSLKNNEKLKKKKDNRFNWLSW